MHNVYGAICTSGIGAMLRFSHGGAADRGGILFGASAVFCAAIEDKHTIIMTTTILTYHDK